MIDLLVSMQLAQSESLRPFKWMLLLEKRKFPTLGDPLMYLGILDAAS